MKKNLDELYMDEDDLYVMCYPINRIFNYIFFYLGEKYWDCFIVLEILSSNILFVLQSKIIILKF